MVVVVVVVIATTLYKTTLAHPFISTFPFTSVRLGQARLLGFIRKHSHTKVKRRELSSDMFLISSYGRYAFDPWRIKRRYVKYRDYTCTSES